jgi:adenine specific DNA methylase Mod
MLMDGIFGAENFRNEVVWKRTTAKALMTRRLPSNHDLLFAYQRTDQAFWNPSAIFTPYDPDDLDEKTEKKYCFRDPDGRRYTLGDLTNPNRNRPNLTYEFLGHHKVWRWTKERIAKGIRSWSCGSAQSGCGATREALFR